MYGAVFQLKKKKNLVWKNNKSILEAKLQQV